MKGSYHLSNPIGRINMQNGIIKGASSIPAIDRTPIARSREFKIRFLALSLACMMVISALAMVLPGMVAGPMNKVPAVSMANNGQREVYYNYSNFFHMTFQDWDWNRTGGNNFETAGVHESSTGEKYVDRMPTWYTPRVSGYGEYIYRGGPNDPRGSWYPHIFYSNPYSTQTTPDVSVGWIMYAPMKASIWARNITDCKTTTDAILVPDLDGNAARPNGGWINASYYLTYLSGNELAQLKSNAYGTHYAAWLFGMSGKLTAIANDDGYWAVLKGKIQYSRQAAMSYLGWAGTGDVRTWFDTNIDTINQAWWDDWAADGAQGGAYDVYTAYDYPVDIRLVTMKRDALNSTSNTLTINVFTISWGLDAQIIRYLEAMNVMKPGLGQGWYEGCDIKARISPNMCNVSLSGTLNYVLTSWEDDAPTVWSGGWKIETQHIDYCGNTAQHTTYNSPFNRYDPDQTNWLTESRSPWTTHFAGQVSYWVNPRQHNLTAWDRIQIQLPTTDVLGIRPGRAVSETQANYLTNLATYQYWGRMVLGKGSWPYADISAGYNAATKSICILGPKNWVNETQTGHPELLLHGVPAFMFDVSPVSYYTVSVTGSHTTTLQDTITIRGYNGTGAVMPTWYNGTVVLSDTDPSANPASTSHTWVAGDNGVWSTTITWATAGTQYVNATDQWFDLDVKGSSGPISVSLIPEFSTLLIPTIGAIAIFLVFRTKRRRKSE